MTAPRAVFFDFAGTLFSDRALRDVHLAQLRSVGETVGVTASDADLRASYREGMGVAYRSIASRPYYLHRELFGTAFVAMASSLGGHLDDDQAMQLVDRQYAATIDGVALRGDCLDTLAALRLRGLHVQIVSNIDDEQLDGLVDRLELASAVDAWTSSQSARSCKPDPGIYRYALDKAGCEAADVLFVGDTQAHDIDGPAALGMSTALLVADARPGSERATSADFVVERLGQVVEIVEQELVRVNEPTDALREFLDERLGDVVDIAVEPMVGGGSCEIFAVDRGGERWVLRRAPSHRSSATAHDVLREFRILDAIKDEAVSIARPVLACDDPAVFAAPFYVMARIDGVPVRTGIPEAWTTEPAEQPRALDQLVDALVAIHAVDWVRCGLGDLAHTGPYLERQIGRWLSQLDSYGGRPLPAAVDVGAWLADHLPPDQAPALAHGDYKLDNVLFAETAPPDLLAVVDWEMASISDPLVDLAWAMIFHPGPEGTMPLGVAGTPGFDRSLVPSRASLVERYGERSGRDVSAIDWYDVFSRWKLAIVLEGSYAKFLRGESKKPVHEYFGKQADLLLASAATIVEER